MYSKEKTNSQMKPNPTMAKAIKLALVVGALGTSQMVFAQARNTYEELYNTIKAPNAFSKLGADLFGDSVNLYNGGLTFTQTDFMLKGNNALPMGVGRRFVAGGFQPSLPYHFGGWTLDIPRMYGVFAAANGWKGAAGNGSRCTSYGEPGDAFGDQGGLFLASEFWQGNHLYVPGVGDQQVLIRGVDNPKLLVGSSSDAVTKDFWSFECVPTLTNANANPLFVGEGFIARSPDGTKYQFDHMVFFNMPSITKPRSAGGALTAISPTTTSSATTTSSSQQQISPSNNSVKDNGAAKKGGGVTPSIAAGGYFLSRVEMWLLPTSITDKYGNKIIFNYDATVPGKLLSITSQSVSVNGNAADDRTITFSYGLAGKPLAITSATDGTRTWNYGYDANGDLSQVTLPDSSKWQFNMSPLRSHLSAAPSSCDSLSSYSATPVTGTITHPSGAVGNFTMEVMKHSRANVTRLCHVTDTGTEDYAKIPKHNYSRSVTQKTITGPGLPSMTWSYAYGATTGTWTTECNAGCQKSKTVTVTDPKNYQTRYTFGIEYQKTEGRLEKTESGWNGSTALRTEEITYNPPNAGPYPSSAGAAGNEDMGDSYINALYVPTKKKTITQQGSTFTWEVNIFDTLARPTQVTKTGTGGSRTEVTAYSDNFIKYVLGQVKTVTEPTSGVVMQQNDYDGTTTSLMASYQFGSKQGAYTYNADGTIATIADGLNQITTLSSYKRGTPRLITYPNNTTESVVVNNFGAITAYTNQANYTTTLGYDAIGRLNLVTPPVGSATSIEFIPIAATEKGIPTGHWRQTVSKGNSRSVTYLDALWRPLITSTYDLNDIGNTEKSVLSRFDHNGSVSFQSYPQRSIASISSAVKGVTTNYDALGRVTTTVADSEFAGALSTLTTTNEYLSGFTKKVTNPRGQSTTSTYQTFDSPSESAILSINAPEGVTVQFTRDIFGKTKSITRSGPGIVNNNPGTVSVTRSYVYDDKHRLCKTIEPEIGATIQYYDDANNMKWRASGASAPSLTSCDHGTGVVQPTRATFDYDSLNRLTTTSYFDGSPSITRTYTPDGLPFTVSTTGTNPTTWTNTYNERRQLTNETLSVGGATYSISRAYDANGSLTSLTYPTQSGIAVVDYAPNALGEATKIGTYASNVKYHPNGAVSNFTYGNGIAHTMLQNVRGLPQQSTDAGIINDTYIYDTNANVQSITDVLEPTASRSMTYDGLDRLKTASGYFGNASYDYDALDNITQSKVGTRTNIHNYNMATNLLSSISSTGGTSYSYAYDALGNITQRGTQAFVFDAANRLKSATGKASYDYDGLGHRVKTTYADGSTQMSLYTQGGQILFTQKVGGSNPGKTSYIYLNRHQIAEVKN